MCVYRSYVYGVCPVGRDDVLHAMAGSVSMGYPFSLSLSDGVDRDAKTP